MRARWDLARTLERFPTALQQQRVTRRKNGFARSEILAAALNAQDIGHCHILR